MTTREKIHQLVDQLSEQDLRPILMLAEDLQAGRDPVLRSMDEAPEDDEPLTPEDIAAIEEGKRDVAEGRVFTTEEVCRELNTPLP